MENFLKKKGFGIPKMPKATAMSWIQNERNMNKRPASSWKNVHLSEIRNKSKGIRPIKGKIHFAN